MTARRLLSSGKYSDCTLVCGEVEYKLHKAVVCSRSAMLDAAFSLEMKVSCNHRVFPAALRESRD